MHAKGSISIPEMRKATKGKFSVGVVFEAFEALPFVYRPSRCGTLLEWSVHVATILLVVAILGKEGSCLGGRFSCGV